MILLLESMEKTGELFLHGRVTLANHQSDLRRTQPGCETQGQEFTLQGIEPGQQRFEQGQALLVNELSIHILVFHRCMKRNWQSIPGNNAFPTPMRINHRMTGNLKNPPDESCAAWLVLG